ncbi:MAG TPA: M48 family metallopeptidase [Micromonosporaceae bacterium]
MRAALAVALLRGYRAGRHVAVWGLAMVSTWTWIVTPGWLPAALTTLTVVTGLLSVRAARVLGRCVLRETTGVPVPPRVDSSLWAEVRMLCDRLRVRLPEEIRIGVDPVIEVSEQPRNLGLAAGPRRLHIGLPLLVGLSPGELRALLAHELAHDSREGGTLPATCHRIRHTLGPALQRRPGGVGIVFAIVVRLFLALEAPASRRQERIADRAAVRLAGRRNVAGMLRELPVLSLAWQRYLAEVVAPAARSGYAPLSISDGFQHMRGSWREELAELRNMPPEAVRQAWDVHPPRLERLHAIDLTPEVADQIPVVDPRPGLTPLVREVEHQLVGPQVRRVPWDEFCAIIAGEGLRGEVDQLFRAAAQVADPADPVVRTASPGLDTVLTLIEAGALNRLLRHLEPATTATARRLLGLAFAQAAVDGGVARWHRAQSGALRVVRPDGGTVPVEELAARVIADPATVPMVREVLRAVKVGGVAHAHG